MDMRMMLLLGSVMLLLVSPAVYHAKPFNRNLSEMVDLISKYNKTIQEKFFVEDVSKLADEDQCGNKFFCKVQNILHKHHKMGDEKLILRNLNAYIGDNINCTELLQGVNHPAVEKPLTDLLENIASCIRRSNLQA